MFKKRLRELRLSRNLTQNKLAQELGIAKSTISMYENGNREPDFETLETIADFFNCDMDYLLGKSDIHNKHKASIPTVTNIIPLPETKKIPLLGSIACGEPILAEENIDDYIKLDKEVPADFALRCKGDSMINARIFDGDIVYIRQQPNVENGEIAAVLIGNEATLKKVHKYPNKLVLSPCNPVYDDLVYHEDPTTEIRILGKAVAFTSIIR